ncbi:MAG TPA: glycosyltransferase family 2 protein [Smithellaceae bacterium]|jgi:glycosyltransferase involved in cell wall biosynthesis|nr:glycosyltransferase family 2 protein [Smithellaceae bacterium]
MIEKRNTPKITIIIPTCNRAHFLKRAVGSVLGQTFTDFKVCIYDNASSDATKSIVQEMMRKDGRVYYHCHKQNIGAERNFQYGLIRVYTPFFSFLSDDDFLLPNFLETTMAGFINNPEALFSAGSVVTMTDRGKVLYEPFSLWEKEGLFLPPEGLLETLGEKYPIWTGILFRRGVIELTGGLDEEMVGAADLDFVYRISAKAPFVISKEPVAICVNHSTSLSAYPSLSAYWPSWLKMIRNITDDKKIPQDIKDEFKTALIQQITATLLWIGICSFERRDFDQAIKVSKILNEELNQGKIGWSLAWLVKQGRKFEMFWHAAVLFITLRRNVMSLVNVKRMKLQIKHGHLAEELKHE